MKKSARNEPKTAAYSTKLRHFDLIRILDAQPSVDIEELTRKLHVSPATVRRDLLELEEKGAVHRVRGGAVRKERLAELEQSFDVREQSHSESKAVIGRAAADIVKDGDVLFIDGGTTTEYLIPHLSGKKNLTIFTCGINIALKLKEIPFCTGIMLGGEIHLPSHTTGGVLALDMLDFYKVRFDKAFIAARAVSAEAGATNHMIERIPIKKKAISVSVQSILLADISKIGQVSVGQIAPLTEFNYFVTDSKIEEMNPLELDAIRQTGVQLILA